MAFAPEPRLTVFACLFLPVLLGLGAWQLERAGEKRQVEDRLDAARASIVRATPIAELDTLADLTVVRVSGRLDGDRAVLVDNRTHGGRPGYELFVPLRGVTARPPDGGGAPGPAAVLIGLGWLPAPPRRSELPAIEVPPGPVAITGLIHGRAGEVPVFGAEAETGWPLRVQRLDVDRIAATLGEPLAARPIMAEAGEPGVRQHLFDPVRMPASTHTGYAVQWFGLAFVLAAGWVLASVRRGALRSPRQETNMPARAPGAQGDEAGERRR